MKEEAKSYEEIIRKKRCIELTRYYNLTEEVLEKIYNFLKENNKGLVKGNKQSITLIYIIVKFLSRNSRIYQTEWWLILKNTKMQPFENEKYFQKLSAKWKLSFQK